MTSPAAQATLFPDDDGVDEKVTRSLLDHLLTESKLYKTGEAYKALLAVIVRMKNFAPFNAMLIHIQKPGIRYLKTHTTVDDLDLYQIMRAAGQIESLLGLTTHTRYEKPRHRTAVEVVRRLKHLLRLKTKNRSTS